MKLKYFFILFYFIFYNNYLPPKSNHESQQANLTDPRRFSFNVLDFSLVLEKFDKIPIIVPENPVSIRRTIYQRTFWHPSAMIDFTVEQEIFPIQYLSF